MVSRLGAVASVVLLVFTLGGSAAFAHGGNESNRSSDLVLQAIALIVNEPGNRAAIQDKVTDALKAKNTKGVDLALVEQANAGLAARDLHRARSLLERSIGARAHGGPGEPASIREVGPAPTGAEPGRALPTDPLVGRSGFDGSAWAVLIGSIAVGLVGVALSVRYRPRRLRETS